MFDPSPSPQAVEKAFHVVSEVFRRTLNGRLLTEDELRTWTHDILETCYAIGASYSDESVRAVATVRAKEIEGSRGQSDR